MSKTLATALASPRCAVLGELLCTADDAQHAVRAALAREGLTLDGFAALLALNKANAPISTLALADEVGTTRALLAHTLSRLQVSGLVTRHMAPTQRRIVQIHVTTLGKKTIRRAARSCRITIQRLTGEITLVQAAATLRLCRAVRRAAETTL